ENAYELIPNYDPSEVTAEGKRSEEDVNRKDNSVLSSILSFFSFLLSSVCFFVAFYFYLYRVSERGVWYAMWTDSGFLFGVTGLVLQYGGMELEILVDRKLMRPLLVCFFVSLCIVDEVC
ncbi:hypothetical protein WA577_003886, partial [Blastocystis sp. JDR]